MPTECCIYTRISADKRRDTDDEGMGVARQEKECRALAKRLGMKVAHVYRDNDVSAYTGKTRPQFEAMLDAVKRGQYDAVIAWHQDRLYRSMEGIERVIEICDPAGVLIHTVSGGDLDVSNATGKGLARIVGSINRMESEHKAERIRAARLQQAEAGVWFTNCRMFGYTDDGKIEQAEATLIRKAASDILSGKSASSIIREWNAAGITTARGNRWILTTFRRLMTNPRYAALCEYRGKVIGPGNWPAVLTVEQHNGLVSVFRDKASNFKGTSWERKWLGTRRYVCGHRGDDGQQCGALMEHYVSKQAHAYRCMASRHLSRQQPGLDELVEKVALALMHDKGRLGAILAAASKDRDGIDGNELRTRRAALQATKDDLAALFTEGVLDAPSVRRESAKLSAQLGDIDAALAELARRSPLAELMSEGAEHLDKRWAAASQDTRGKVIDELFTVVVNPASANGGRGGFDPDCIEFLPPKGR
jgi:DNA invertase Pin-like site-specific DNA recombinase